jgi:hypothetical protein
MNAKLYILAILTIIILALYMTVSAPAQKPVPEQSVVEQTTIALKVESYKTLGGDCSADRATGDLYVQSHDPYANQPDPYCLTDQGPTNNLLSDLDKDRGSDTSYVPTEKQTNKPVNDSSIAQTDKRAKKQKDDKSTPPSSELANIPVTGNTNGPSSGQTNAPGSSDPQINPQPGNPDEGGSKPKDDKPSHPQGNTDPNAEKQHKDKDNGSSEHKVNQKPDNPGKDQSTNDKQCKKDGRDNTNSQGNHNCSADNPDTNSDQQRSTDHGPDNQGQGNSHDKEKKDK